MVEQDVLAGLITVNSVVRRIVIGVNKLLIKYVTTLKCNNNIYEFIHIGMFIEEQNLWFLHCTFILSQQKHRSCLKRENNNISSRSNQYRNLIESHDNNERMACVGNDQCVLRDSIVFELLISNPKLSLTSTSTIKQILVKIKQIVAREAVRVHIFLFPLTKKKLAKIEWF